ncbi:MAG: nitronate monooxygenase [Alphaproteobacteria bacterium]|nr:nitronate monooxygenase [Alphaproteobacteria bacterium]MDP6624169.1 nitronate monooxygenase [Alphaproteobacteria bacterium]
MADSDRRGSDLRAWRQDMRLPVIAAPMFLVSGPELVIACCKAGVIGSFPTVNARTPEDLDAWLTRIDGELAAAPNAAPPAANLVVHRTNPRRDDDLAIVVEHKIPLVIASVGSPAAVVEPIHAYGGLVLADVASLKHARQAIEVGVDGLILLCAGAGGNTGWLNPFAFVPEVREFYDGPLVVAGCIGDGRAIRAIETIGADFAYIGTRFIAASESQASAENRQMLVESSADDIQLTDAVTGIDANFLRPSLEASGYTKSHDGEGFNVIKETTAMKAWKDVWSAGQGVGFTKSVAPVADIVAELESGYRAG